MRAFIFFLFDNCGLENHKGIHYYIDNTFIFILVLKYIVNMLYAMRNYYVPIYNMEQDDIF